MSVKDLSKAWDEAAQRALDYSQKTELTRDQFCEAAGMRVRTGIAAGDVWGMSLPCTDGCP